MGQFPEGKELFTSAFYVPDTVLDPKEWFNNEQNLCSLSCGAYTLVETDGLPANYDAGAQQH